jgi:hypothetical protein
MIWPGDQYKLPILHFSGKFKTQPPLYNNTPYNTEKYFDEEITPKIAKKEITYGVEPLEYFEFKFHNVNIKMVTYDDGMSISRKEEDVLIGKQVMLKGLLIDTAPHLERSRLFAGEVRIIDLMMGKLEEGFESDLFTTIRGDKGKDAMNFSADFESKIYNIHSLAGDFITTENSRFFRELDLYNINLKIYFHLSKFNYATLEGEVHGYIGLHIPELDDQRFRIHGRRLLIDPCITDELKKDFMIQSYQEEAKEVARNDLEGTYEILREKKLVVLRYLNCIPYLDTHHKIPAGYTFFVIPLNNGNEIKSDLPLEIKVDQESVSRSGGICVVHFPDNFDDLSGLSLLVVTRKNMGNALAFMKEPEYDLLINNNQKYLVLESGKKAELKVLVYQNNCPAKDKNIRVILETYENDRSPTVARWTTSRASSDNSLLTCYIQAHNIEDSEEIEDPVTGIDPKTEKIRGKISGDLPWDRYYGNYLSIKIDNNSIRRDNKKELVIKFNIPVRVLHSVRLDRLKDDIDQLNIEKIQEVVTKLLSYYARYYPWLHTQYTYTGLPPQPARLAYQQFLKIREYLSYVDKEGVDNWDAVEHCVTRINHFLDRLTKPDDDWRKMPRSRDFPFNGIEFLNMYKESIIDNVITSINDERDKIIKSEQKGAIEIDMEEWKQIQTLLNNLGNMTNHLSDEDKKLITIWKLQIYDNMLHALNIAKTQTKHLHKH